MKDVAAILEAWEAAQLRRTWQVSIWQGHRRGVRSTWLSRVAARSD